MEIRGLCCKCEGVCPRLPGMKMKLAYRLFFAFFLTVVVIAALMVCVQIYVIRSFSEYAGRVELDKLKDLEANLRELHARNDDWTPLLKQPELWRELLEEADVPMSPPPPPQPPGADPRNAGAPDRRPPVPDEDWQHTPYPPPPPPTGPPHGPGGRRGRRSPFWVGARLALFDADKNPVAGAHGPAEQFTLKPIESDGEIIGWLGLHRRRHVGDPLAAAFRRRQSTFFILTTAAALVLTALVTLIVSRQILKPVKALKEGTRALIARRFHKRIIVRSGDELGQLADDFNTLARTLE